MTRPDGKAISFAPNSGGGWRPEHPDITDRLVATTDGSGDAVWLLTTAANDEVKTFSAANGRLLSIRNRTGLTVSLAYDEQGRLASVTDHVGRALTFGFDSYSRITEMRDPANGLYTYKYSVGAMVDTVTYPDGTSRQYKYERPNYNNLLTGIVNEGGVTVTTYAYDPNTHNATLSTRAGNADRVDISYVNTNLVRETDARNTVRNFALALVQGVSQNHGVDLPGANCRASGYTFDSTGHVASQTDFVGNRTNFSRASTDTLGRHDLVLTRIEGLTSGGASTSVTRTTTTEWHPTFRLVKRMAEPKRLLLRTVRSCLLPVKRVHPYPLFTGVILSRLELTKTASRPRRTRSSTRSMQWEPGQGGDLRSVRNPCPAPGTRIQPPRSAHHDQGRCESGNTGDRIGLRQPRQRDQDDDALRQRESELPPGQRQHALV